MLHPQFLQGRLVLGCQLPSGGLKLRQLQLLLLVLLPKLLLVLEVLLMLGCLLLLDLEYGFRCF